MTRSLRFISAAAMLLVSALVFTSCEGAFDDLFGEWSRPTTAEIPPAQSISFAESEKWWGTEDGKFTLAVTNTGDGIVTYSSSNPSAASVDPTTGEVTPGTVATSTVETVTITATVADSKSATYPTKTAQYTLKLGKGYRYLKWDNPSKKVVYCFDYSAFTNDFIDSSIGAAEKLQSGGAVKFVKGHITISEDVTIGNDLLLVLLDGAKLEINGQLGVATSKDLSISAQSEGEDKGEFVVKHTSIAIDCKHDMTIYGGKITSEVTGTEGSDGLIFSNSLNIYGGDVTVKGGDRTTSSGSDGIKTASGSILITGKAIVNVTGGNSESSPGGNGIYTYGELTVSGEAQVTATGGNSAGGTGGYGIKELTIEDNGYVKAKGGDTNASGYDGGAGVSYIFTYKGGKFEAYGGKNGDGTTYKWALNGTLKNESSAPVDFETSTDGTTWNGTYTLTNVAPGNSVSIYSTLDLQKRGVRKL